MSDSHIDPMVLLMATLMAPKRKPAPPPPPTPEQIKRREQEAKRAQWNRKVEARKAAKKGLK